VTGLSVLALVRYYDVSADFIASARSARSQ
jgi:hypothetical protein